MAMLLIHSNHLQLKAKSRRRCLVPQWKNGMLRNDLSALQHEKVYNFIFLKFIEVFGIFDGRNFCTLWKYLMLMKMPHQHYNRKGV